MSMQLIERMEARLKGEVRLDATSRQELLALLASLKAEVAGLEDEHAEHAESIAGFAGAATHEATRHRRNPDLLKLALDGLSESVKDVETGHPRLVETVNGICTMLSDLGI